MIFELASVVNNIDDTGGGRIQVRVWEDAHRGNSKKDLPWCMPILPKHIHIQPKKGECVLIFAHSKKELYGNALRWYIGPVITQLNKLEFQDAKSATSYEKGSFFDVGENPYNVTGSEGVYPETGKEEREFGNNVSLLGRHGGDVILKDGETWYRTGVHKQADNAVPGKKGGRIFGHPTYIKQKEYKNLPTYTRRDRINNVNKEVPYKTVTTIVADEINLISSSGDRKKAFDVLNSKEMITDKVMKEILEEAHCLPFGDILVKYLSILHQCFLNHVHIQGNGQKKPDKEKSEMPEGADFVNFDFNTILSNNVRIN